MMGQIHPSDGSRVEFIKRVAKILRILFKSLNQKSTVGI